MHRANLQAPTLSGGMGDLSDTQRLMQAAMLLTSLLGISVCQASLSCLPTVNQYYSSVVPQVIKALQTRGEARTIPEHAVSHF